MTKQTTATPESVYNAPQIARRTRINDNPYQGSIVIDQAICTNREADDPVIEIFVATRKKHMGAGLSASIIPAVGNAIGWEYSILPSNVEDGELGLIERFQDYLENRIAPDFEERLIAFFEDADGYAAYKVCLEENEIEAANKVIENFIYRTASANERKALDKKAVKKKKEEAKKANELERRKSLLRSLGVPATLLLL
ncbi:hypothetical protein IJH02_02130 [Candidatus Saccharibacteria bacterium]|nr:hypothetical protein [Candidatus Saccharibacteria bacterium]